MASMFDDLVPAKAGMQPVTGHLPATLSFDDLVPAKTPDSAPPEDEGFSLPDAASLYGGSVLAAVTGGGVGGTTARKWIADAASGLLGGVVEGAGSAVTAPGRAYSGELQVMGPDGNVTPEAIAEGVNFAGVASPASVASPISRTAVQKAARSIPEQLAVSQAGQRLGVDLPRAVTSDTTAIQQAGKILANVPVVGTPLRKASQQALEQLGEAATRTQQGYGLADMAASGSGVRSGLADFSKNVLGARVKDSYDAVDDLVTQNVVTPLSRTRAAAGDVLARRMGSMQPGSSSAVSKVERALASPDGLNYRGIKDLRTSIREMLDDPQQLASGGISQNELDAIYRGLSDDLRLSVARGGGKKASEAFEAANTLAATVAKEREAFDKILGRNASDENIFSKIEAMAGSTARADQSNLMRLRSSLSDDTWGDLGATVLSRIGRDKEGNFSPDRFITGWGKLSNTGKSLLFKSGPNKELASSLDDIAQVSSRFKQLNQFANPSGSGQTIVGGGIGAGLLAEPVTTLASIAGGRVASELLSRPVSARKLANWAKSYELAATKPSRGAGQILGQRAQALSLEIAESLGDPSLASQILPGLSKVYNLPADPRSKDQGADENQQGSKGNKPRTLLPTEI